MKQWLLLAGITLLFFPYATGQNYFIYLNDKPETVFCPETYFHPKALERRTRNGLPMWDERDLPVSQDYVNIISKYADSVRYQLRWLNSVTVAATPDQITKIARLPFVERIEPMVSEAVTAGFPAETDNRYDTLLSLTRDLMNIQVLEDSGLSGEGVRIAVLDVGFKHADIHPALEKVRSEGRIIATRDFYDGDDHVYHHSHHGTEVMSCISGIYRERNLGCAPGAEFLLARIEHETKEKPIEEDHWIAAAEWADKMGADIINSSITYTDKRYTFEDMTGKTAPVSRGAAIAASKGMVIVCSMGNEGDDKWQFMGAPADVPEVLSVGGSMPMLPMRIKFGSKGPNALHQLKPDISAPGYVLSALKKDGFGERAGTSFSAPLIAGLAACLIEKCPQANREEIFDRIHRLGHFYPYYDYDLGYGVADAAKIFRDSAEVVAPTFEVIHRSDSIIMKLDTAYMYRDSLNFPNGRVLYVHLENKEGYLSSYFPVRLPNNTKYYFFRRQGSSRGTMRIWLGGYLYEEKIEE